MTRKLTRLEAGFVITTIILVCTIVALLSMTYFNPMANVNDYHATIDFDQHDTKGLKASLGILFEKYPLPNDLGVNNVDFCYRISPQYQFNNTIFAECGHTGDGTYDKFFDLPNADRYEIFLKWSDRDDIFHRINTESILFSTYNDTIIDDPTGRLR